jgi:hypothetical protein
MATTRAAGRMGDPTMQTQGKRGGQRFGIKGSDISSAFRERMVVVKEKIEPIAGVLRRLVAKPGILIMFVGSIIFLAAVAMLVTLSLLMTKCNSGVWIPACLPRSPLPKSLFHLPLLLHHPRVSFHPGKGLLLLPVLHYTLSLGASTPQPWEKGSG